METAQQTTKLILRVENGMTSAGKTAYAQRTFANITPTLSDDDVYSIGKKLAALQGASVGAISRQDAKSFRDGE